MTLTPYWRGKGITLYHGRAEDVLPHIKGAVTITDPPYNCGVNYGKTTNDRQPWPEWCAWWDRILELCQAATPDVLAFMSQTTARKYQRLGRYEPDWALAWVKPLALACTALPFMPHWEAILYWGKTRKRDGAFWGGDVLTCNVAKDDFYVEVPTCGCIQPEKDTCVGAITESTGCTMMLSGKNGTDQSQEAILSTTRISTSKTTDSKISISLTPPRTNDCIVGANGVTIYGGKNAPTAENPNRLLKNTGTFVLRAGQASHVVGPAKSRVQYGTRSCAVCGQPYEKRSHPTPKPMPLMRELVSRFDGPIIDPFAGSGTTLRACLELGKEAVGVEVNEAYCAMAVRRLERWHKEPEAQAVMALEVTG